MGILLSKLSNLFDSFGDNPMRILMLGLDAAGEIQFCAGVMLILYILQTIYTLHNLNFADH